MHDYPAGRFAVWATAWLTGRTSYDEALDALLGDAAHRVAGLPGTDEAVPLGWALTALRSLGERRFRLVLPVPGDVRGLPAVPGLAALALESGQAAVGERLVLVPEAVGPEAVAWTAFPLDGAPPVPPPVEGSLRAVSGALDLAVGDAARTLAGLDLARWNPEVPTLLAGLAKTTAAPGLPYDHDPLALSVLGPGAAAGGGAGPGDGRRPGRRGEPRPGGCPRPRAAPAGAGRARGHDRRLQRRAAGLTPAS